jgi:hypothetical protein
MTKEKTKSWKFSKENIDNIVSWTINVFSAVSILIGITILIVFIIKLSSEYTVSSSPILLDKTGQVGDFIGGLIGTLWALTGVLLFYSSLRLQRKELSLQRKELKESRSEFIINRITSILYQQLEHYNKHVDRLIMKDVEKDESGYHNEYKGYEAIGLIEKRLELVYELSNKEYPSEEKKKDKLLEWSAHNFAFLELNKKELYDIFNSLDNTCDVIESVLMNENISINEIHELKMIFFKNIGVDFLNKSDTFTIIISAYIDFKAKGNDKEDPLSTLSLLPGKINRINRFRNKMYSKKDVEDYQKGRDLYNQTYI